MFLFSGLSDQGENRTLELREPIAVENSGKPIGMLLSNFSGGFEFSRSVRASKEHAAV